MTAETGIPADHPALTDVGEPYSTRYLCTLDGCRWYHTELSRWSDPAGSAAEPVEDPDVQASRLEDLFAVHARDGHGMNAADYVAAVTGSPPVRS